MPSLLARFFSTEHMVEGDFIRGALPASKEAYKTSLDIALPSMTEMISSAVMGMVSTAMVGRLGPYAVAAVGLTGQPRMIFQSVFFAMNVGVTAIVSRRKGQDDRGSAQSCIRQSLMIALFLSLVMSTLAISTSEWMMRLAGAKEDTLGPASGYFRIMSIGIAVQAISTSICAAQRGIGNTRVTMVCNLTANVTNIILCYLLIGGNLGFPQLGVNGAAIAMVGGFAVSMVMAFLSLLRKDAYLRISFRDSWKPDIPMIKSILHIGVGSMIEQVALRVGFFVYARVVADLGTASFAAHQIASQLMVLSFTFAEGIGVATTSLVGQNLGKNRPDLSIMYGKIGQRMAIAIAVCISIISIVARHFFASLFTSDKAIIDLTANIVLILAMILPVQTSHIVMGGSLRGAGDVKYVAFTMLMTVTIIRPVFSIVMVYVFHLGLIGAWVAMVFDQVVRMILLFRRFSKGKWIGIDV